MNQVIFIMSMLIGQYFNPRFNAELKLLIFQVKMLRIRIHALKIVPTTRERLELLKLGARSRYLPYSLNGNSFTL